MRRLLEIVSGFAFAASLLAAAGALLGVFVGALAATAHAVFGWLS